MKRGVYVGILAAVAVICIILHVLEASSSAFFSAMMAFPFEQIGFALRTLSLSGTVGNVVAVALYAVICLIPGVILLHLQKKRKLYAEDGLLALFSVVLFATLYLMINPGLIIAFTRGASGLSVGKAMLGGALYSILCGYLILRVLRLFYTGSTDKLMGYLSVMLRLLGVLFAYIMFGTCINSFLDSIATLRAGNAGSEHLLGVTYFFLGLQLVLDAMPYGLNLVIVFAGLRLLHEMLTNRYSAETVTAAGRLSRLCIIALITTILSNIGFNLLQLLFANSLMIVNGSVQIPVFSIAFVLSVLLLTRFTAENKQLKDDNDLFV